MRVNGEYYKHFLEVNPGGGTRRNPKRKNAGTFSTRSEAASAADVDAVFEGHLSRMAKGGTYGDNMEVVAFSEAFNVNVTIYKREFAYCIKDDAKSRSKTVYIAYHVSHQSSRMQPSNKLICCIDLRTLFICPKCPWSAHRDAKHRTALPIC